MMHQHDSAESLSRSTCRYSNKSSKQITNQLTYREKTKLLPSKYNFDSALSFFSIFFRVLLYLSAPGFHFISFLIFQWLTFISSLSCPSSLDYVFQSPRLSGRTNAQFLGSGCGQHRPTLTAQKYVSVILITLSALLA